MNSSKNKGINRDVVTSLTVQEFVTITSEKPNEVGKLFSEADISFAPEWMRPTLEVLTENYKKSLEAKK